ncbi:uncharacterized protein [Arachis hypogaea]|uniref:uncharacterized protein n=1 Tax=Arachis hypogaea TaxID=3818 RepID=UPI001105722A|nr:uncharacterized protein LOC114925384 [Arachis hypogaea]
MYFLLTTLKVAYVLTIPRPPEVEREAIVKTRAKQKWDNDDYICTGHILNGIADALFDVYQNQGCRNWKKVNSKKECALLNHIGKDPNSFHHKALKSCDDLMKQSQHIDRLLHKQTSEEIEKNRIRLGASIDCIRWLTFQGCAYRGHDESQSSSNRARDESKKEQMAIVLRFVTLDGFVKERFFDLVHVTDTCATTLKKELIFVLSHYNLQVKNIRGQGYDGASNMRGEWNGLQALFLKDSPQAYYVHCFAYRLQLALVAASREIMGITNVLCQALQQQSQDILNAMHIVSTSKLLLQQLRDGGWCNFLANVKNFCEKHEIEVLNMSAQYVFGRGRSRQPSVTVEHHYRIDVFLTTIDSQIQELNSRFNEQTIELLTLSCALDPKDNFKSFNIEEISKLAEKFYPIDFPSNELNILKSQLQYYQHDIPNHLKGIGTLSELCNKLQETGKSRTYHMVDRLIRLVLTLSVSTATTERAFSAMKIVKTRLRKFKRTMKHRKDDVSLEQLSNHLRLEEEYRKQDDTKEQSAHANLHTLDHGG